ncbi:MAG: hypothetical protein HY207_12025 [Nitrospirae bacterium]|nr:hypothetical protein [Nitrospirota bacterium]
MDDTDPETVAHVLPPIVADGQAVKIRRLAALEPFHGRRIVEQSPCFIKIRQVPVKVLDKFGGASPETLVQFLQESRIMLAEIKERLSTFNGLAVDAPSLCNGRGDLVERFSIHHAGDPCGGENGSNRRPQYRSLSLRNQ